MVLAAFGAGGETGAPSAIGTTPALDAIPYSSEGAQIGAGVIDGVLQFSLAFANLLEPVVTHDAAAAAALTGAVLPSGMKNGPVQYSVAIDQLDDATALNPGFASVSALAVALSSAVAAVQTLNFGLQVTKPAVSKVFNIAQGISATRRVYGNLQNGSTPSLALS